MRAYGLILVSIDASTVAIVSFYLKFGTKFSEWVYYSSKEQLFWFLWKIVTLSELFSLLAIGFGYRVGCTSEIVFIQP